MCTKTVVSQKSGRIGCLNYEVFAPSLSNCMVPGLPEALLTAIKPAPCNTRIQWYAAMNIAKAQSCCDEQGAYS